MSEFIRAWFKRGEAPRNMLIKYIEWNGILYIVLGMAFFVLPETIVSYGLLPMLQGNEKAYIMILGFTLLIIGYFYYFGARTHSTSFALSTVFDRIILVPVFLGIMVYVTSFDLEYVVPFLILDPSLAIGAWLIWLRTK